MEQLKLCDSDYRFMSIVWDYAPIPSTYTTIKKMSEKGYIKNENAFVTVLISKERVQRDESDYFVERTFGGSLPNFLTAFLGGKKISAEEAQKIKDIIDRYSDEK